MTDPHPTDTLLDRLAATATDPSDAYWMRAVFRDCVRAWYDLEVAPKLAAQAMARDAWHRANDEAEAMLDAARALHHSIHTVREVCRTCLVDWPCATARALGMETT